MDCRLIPKPFSASVPRDCWGVKLSGALSYSAGLSLLLESPFNMPAWKSDIQRFHPQLDFYVYLSPATCSPELWEARLHVWILTLDYFNGKAHPDDFDAHGFTSFSLGMPCKHIFPHRHVCWESCDIISCGDPHVVLACVCVLIQTIAGHTGAPDTDQRTTKIREACLYTVNTLAPMAKWNFGSYWMVDSQRCMQLFIKKRSS